MGARGVASPPGVDVRERPGDRPWILATRAAVAAGLALTVLAVARAQSGGDQFYLLARGWMFAFGGWWVPFGLHTSSGGFSPGGLTSLFAGLPLWVWADHRALGAFVALGHAVAGVLMWRTCRRALSARGLFLLVVLWWLNPWRLYHSAFAWNSSWMFLVGAVHLATSRATARRPSFAATFVHVAVVGLAVQLHNSFLILVLASIAMTFRRVLRPHVGGILAGGAFAAATLVPWAQLVAVHPELLPVGGHGFLGRGLLYGFPLIRGLGYLVRYSSLALGRQATRFDFTSALGATADRVLTPVADGVVLVGGIATALVALVAFARWWRRAPRPVFGALPPDASERDWLVAYSRWTLIGALAAFALSPTTIMLWQGFIVFHAAVLPTVLFGEALLRSRRRVAARRGAVAWTAATLAVSLGLALAGPMYRRGGRTPAAITLGERYEFVDRLGLDRTGLVRIDPDDGARSRLFLGPDRWADCPPAERVKM